MCEAIREWAEEERSIGFAEGQQVGRMEDADIMAIAECDKEFIEQVRIEL